ncbi:fimbrial protein [Serratia proteamaculans]|uniref:fimbrial protein n=1 Tax=Serratia proteamaculans TaxID=28151 RepID=UPI003D055CC9
MKVVTLGHLAFCMLALLPWGQEALAKAAGWGRVNMQGAVIETACAIDTHSRDQTIDMSVLPLSQIIRDGQGTTRPFTINLVNCVLGRIDSRLPDWKRFQITFDGQADNGLFAIAGRAKGIALQITDHVGNIASPGKPLPMVKITEGDKKLNYTLRLVSNQQLLHAGDYTSSIRFKMDYY